jgi:integrase
LSLSKRRLAIASYTKFWDTTRDQVDIIRLILLTGCRSGEIYRLRWKEIRPGRLELEDSKTGPRAVLLGEAAIDLLRRRRRERKRGSPFVFPSAYDPSKPRRTVRDVSRRIRAKAGLADDIRLHDLRHIAHLRMIPSGGLPSV